MLKNFVHRLLRHRHFWRDMTFDELSELYVSMMFRTLALSLIGIFIPIYLVTTGYSLPTVFLFYIMFFSARFVMDIIGGYVVGRVGPKHTMLISYFAQIAAALLFLTLPEQNWPLILPAVLWGTSNSLFYVAFHVDFSKVKHTDHGGKELGYINVMERIGGALGPVVGGVVAALFGAQYIFMVAVALLFIGLVPLFRTAEPVKTKQHIDFKALPVGKLKRDFASYAAMMVENNLHVVLWPLFLGLFVLGDHVYLKLGGLASTGVFVSIAAAYGIGKLVDEHRGGLLLRFGSIANAVLNLFRPFVSTLGMAFFVNTVNELLVVSFRIPYHKGMYDASDNLPGHRIAYITVMEAIGSLCKLFVWLELYMLSLLISGRNVIVLGFMIAAAASLLIMVQRYPALEYAKKR